MRLGFLVAGALAAGCTTAPAPQPLAFEKHTLDAAFRAEAVAVVDVDRDGHPDIVTDQYWYAGPAFTPHEIRTPETYDPATAWSHGFAVYPWDVDGDGWPDLVVSQFPYQEEAVWYRNPGGGADVHWDRYVIAPAHVSGLETPIVVELFGDGQPVLLMTDVGSGVLCWATPPADPTQPWPLQPISAAHYVGAGVYQHGIGSGDLDGDGKLDVLTGYGWFQQTADRSRWIAHDVPFGPDRCSQLQVADANGDGRADVFCSAPHDYGFAWWHQEPDGNFTAADIDDSISQQHALAMDDLDGDGVPELVTGKRWWAHGPTLDPGSGDPPLLTMYRLRRTVGTVRFERVDLDAASGIGTSFALADADGDGRKDIVVSNKNGLFWFRSR